ncbi:curli assembly protein CsgF [Azospirillum picis]|uniref:Curli production assembly/transport component CsgF n=1 Tax=Azospirillum picis TaxID=488438 RepID=A0ABU0MU64_9PROT|nr:curli assembly protein CsgF [Azospirillum picis]MBP2300935.1 curli production assembly/transport component CsgF [Azospirillum picis]MDQ0537039.1 curli production assembly/transport component CsgF [Azospirillum picis]
MQQHRLSIVFLSLLVLPPLFWTALPACAGELVYTPTNPSFGGNPFYSDHLLGIANANNKFEKPSSNSGLLTQQDPSKEFERVIQSSLLSRISSQIADQIYGENARDSGHFVIGSTTVDFTKGGGATSVTISDASSGGQTVIQIPTPGY